MKITASAVSLNVDDVPASVRFLTTHFGFTETISADGFASLARPDAGLQTADLGDHRGGHHQGITSSQGLAGSSSR